MKPFLIVLMLFLLLVPTSEAISLGQGVIFKPDNTSNGSFIINQTAIMDEIVVNDTDVKFSNIGTNYQLVESINSSGGVLSVLCPNQANCTLSQVLSNIILLFTNNITVTPVAPSGGGGGGVSGGVTYDFSCDKQSCYGCNLKCIVILKNTNAFPVNVTSSYDMYLNEKKQTTTKTYPLQANETKALNEYFTIYTPSSALFEQLTYAGKTYDTSKVIATFSPNQTQKMALFDVKSFLEIYKVYILSSVIVIIVIAYFLWKRIKARKLLKVDKKA